jgi:hypothetical protein
MLKKILFALLFAPLLALAQSYPSPTFNNLTVQGTFTATGKVSLASLATQAANTVVANATNSTASPTAVTVTGCNGAAQALQWTNGTGFGCNSGIATSGANANITSLTGLSTPLSVAQGGTGVTSSTGSGAVVLGTSPTISGATITTGSINNTPIGATTANTGRFTTVVATSTITPSTTSGIVGTTLADSANAGSLGEFITATGTGVSATNGAATNVTSISLTAGDWDVWGSVQCVAAGSTIIQACFGSVSTVSATHPAAPNYGGMAGMSLSAGSLVTVTTPMQRINVSTTTTVFLVGSTNFTTSTETYTGSIWARRRR